MASMPPLNERSGGSGMSRRVSTEMDSPSMKMSVMERWAWASSEASGRSMAGWVWAHSTVETETVETLADPTGVGGGATAPEVLHSSSGAPLVGGFPSAAASPRTDWMSTSIWPGWMAGWSFWFRGDGAMVGGPGGRVGGSGGSDGSDGSDDIVVAGGRGGSGPVGGGSAGGRYGCLDANDLACG